MGEAVTFIHHTHYPLAQGGQYLLVNQGELSTLSGARTTIYQVTHKEVTIELAKSVCMYVCMYLSIDTYLPIYLSTFLLTT